MVDRAAIIDESIKAMEAGDIERIDPYLSDDLVFHGVLLGDLDKQGFMAIIKALAHGLPDWSFHHKIAAETAGQVLVRIQVTATHTNDLHLPFPGMPPIEATHKTIKMPKEMLRFTFDGDQVCEIHVEPVEGGDLKGLLEHLGVVPTDSGL
jgi:hypothetical protein